MAYSLPKLITEKMTLSLHGDEFSDSCHKHHIEGVLYYFYDDFKSNESFKNVWIQNWHRNDLALKTLVDMLDLSTLQFSPVLLKGAALLGEVYEDMGSRFMSDIDLLIHPTDFVEVEKQLVKSGFKLINSKKWKANNFKSEWSIHIGETEICFELHSKLYYHCDNEYESFEKEASHLDGYLRLGKLDQFIHLSTHYAFQHTFQSLYWGFDLFFFSQKYLETLEKSKLLIRAKEFKVLNSTLFCLGVLNDHFNVHIDIHKEHLTSKKIDADFLWSEERRSFEYLKVKHQTKDSFIQALEYDLLHFFSRF